MFPPDSCPANAEEFPYRKRSGLLSTAVINRHVQKQFGEGRVCFTSRVRDHH